MEGINTPSLSPGIRTVGGYSGEWGVNGESGIVDGIVENNCDEL